MRWPGLPGTLQPTNPRLASGFRRVAACYRRQAHVCAPKPSERLLRHTLDDEGAEFCNLLAQRLEFLERR